MRRRLTLVAVVTFVALDLVLVLLAVRHVGSRPSPSDDAVAPGSPVGPSGPSQAGPSEDEPTPAAEGPTTGVLLSLSDDGTAVRAERGACGGTDPRVELSSDSGATFDDVRPDVTSVLRVQAVSESEVVVTGTDASCEPRTLVTDDLGDSWRSVDADGWSLSPGDRQQVLTPDGAAEPGCWVRALDVVEESVARVVCATGVLRGTEDRGQEWVTLGSLEGVRTVAYRGPSSVVALAPTPECGARLFSSGNGGSRWDERGCLDGSRIEAVAANERIVLAQVDGRIARSTDQGVSFDVASD